MSVENRPSKKQRELLSFIGGFITGHGYGPSYREIMRALNYKSVSTVAIHVDNLIKKGQLNKKDHSARSLEVVNLGTTQFKDKPEAYTNQEKWLVEQIKTRFGALRDRQPTKKEVDNLYVLVGALKVLGFSEPAKIFKGKLSELGKQ